jgi:hypothetical protein
VTARREPARQPSTLWGCAAAIVVAWFTVQIVDLAFQVLS